MSPFNADQQFPTFKRFAAAWPPRRVARTILAPGRWTLRVIKKTYKYTLGLLLVLVLAHIIATLILGRLLKEDIAALKAKGEPISAADLAAPKIPDSENGAVLYAKAFELMSTPQAEKDQDVLNHFLTRTDREKDPSLWTKAGAAMPRCREILRLAEEASSRPKCRFPVKWENGGSAGFPHLAKFRSMTQMARAGAMLNAKNGRMEDAIKSVKLGFGICESLKDEPVLISYLVRVTVTAIAAGSVEDILEYGSVSESQAKHLFDGLASIKLGPDAANAIRTERPMGLWAFDQVRTAKVSLYEMMGFGTTGNETMETRLSAAALRLRPVLYADERCYLRRMDRTVHNMGMPYREQSRRGLDKVFDENFPRYAYLTAVLNPTFRRVRAAGDRIDTSIAGVRTLLALAAYKDRFGSYPSSLADLESRLGWKLPDDEFSGKPLVYRQQGKGFILYSIGENLKDDGAKPRPPGSSYSDGYEYDGPNGQRFADIVWQMDH